MRVRLIALIAGHGAGLRRDASRRGHPQGRRGALARRSRPPGGDRSHRGQRLRLRSRRAATARAERGGRRRPRPGRVATEWPGARVAAGAGEDPESSHPDVRRAPGRRPAGSGSSPTAIPTSANTDDGRAGAGHGADRPVVLARHAIGRGHTAGPGGVQQLQRPVPPRRRSEHRVGFGSSLLGLGWAAETRGLGPAAHRTDDHHDRHTRQIGARLFPPTRQTQDTSVPCHTFVTQVPGGASRLAALLLSHKCPICSLVAPCQPGAALRDLGNERVTRNTRHTYAGFIDFAVG